VLFMTSLDSISSIMSTLVKLTLKTLEDLAAEGLKYGVSLNFVAPPALFKKNSYSLENIQKLRGGFPSFIGRLQNSLDDPSDTNRPTFKDSDFVGGWVILIDTEKIDELWSSLMQLRAFFKELNKFDLNLTPPPPNNLRGACSMFDTTKKTLLGDITIRKFGVQLEWDNNYMCSAYKISRGINPQGSISLEDYIPVTLMGDSEIDDPGLFPTGWKMLGQLISGQPVEIPKKAMTVYKDPLFEKNGPVLVPNTLSKTLKYIDYALPESFTDRYRQVYYVIQSCSEGGAGPGPNSKILTVTIKRCNDMYNLANVVEQPNGSFEILSWGTGGIGAWTSIQLDVLFPWLKDLVDMITNLIGSLSAMTGKASDSLKKFIEGIQKRVNTILGIIRVLTYILIQLKTFVLSPSILLLKLGPKQGGVNNFVQRIQNAKLPPDDPGFSGANGITVGLVALYGATGLVVEALEDAALVADAAASAAASLAELSLGSPAERDTANVAAEAKRTAKAAWDAVDAYKMLEIQKINAAFDMIFKLFGK